MVRQGSLAFVCAVEIPAELSVMRAKIPTNQLRRARAANAKIVNFMGLVSLQATQ